MEFVNIRSSVIAILVFLASIVTAGLPDCAVSCWQTLFREQCVNNFICNCQSGTLITNYSCCVSQSCNSTDQLLAMDELGENCGAFNPVLPTTAACPPYTDESSTSISETASTSGSSVVSSSQTITSSDASNTTVNVSIAKSGASSITSADTMITLIVPPITVSYASSVVTFSSLPSSRVSNGTGASATAQATYTANTASSSPGLPTGARAGIGAGASSGGLAIIGMVVFFVLRHRAHNNVSNEDIDDSLAEKSKEPPATFHNRLELEGSPVTLPDNNTQVAYPEQAEYVNKAGPHQLGDYSVSATLGSPWSVVGKHELPSNSDS